MIHGNYWLLQDDDALARIDAAAVRLLESGGCRIEHDGLLAIMADAGCRVDSAARRCFFPEALIRTVLDHLRGNPATEVTIPSGWNPQRQMWMGGSYPHLLDWPSGERRLASRQDLVDLAKMGHMLPEFTGIGRVLNCVDVHPRLEPLWATLQLAEITDKPIGSGEIFFAEYIEPLVRMGEVLTGTANDTSLIAACDFFIAPLVFDTRQAACFLEKRRFNMINMPGTMPISGISAPVTLAGTVTVAVAELIAGWVMGYAVNPALPATGIVSSGSLDMRTTAACFGSPEALLQDATVVELCRRCYGIGVGAATGYVDCKRPGIDAVFQKMLPLVAAPFGLGLNPGGGGLLSAGQDYSPVQHLLDQEMQEAVERFWGTFAVDDETIAEEMIMSMLTQKATNFLDTEHTLAHYKEEQWYPRWLDRTLWQNDAGEHAAEQQMLARMDAYCKDAIRRYEPPALDQSKLAELRRIVQVAERELPVSSSPSR